MSELHDMDRRVAALERIAQDTATALADIRSEMRGLRTESTTELRAMRTEFAAEARQMRSDFRWPLRIIIAGFVGTWALIAHGLHWF